MMLTLQQAADRLGKPRRQVRYLIEHGRLPATKRGKQWRIDEDDLPRSAGQNEAARRTQRARWAQRRAWRVAARRGRADERVSAAAGRGARAGAAVQRCDVAVLTHEQALHALDIADRIGRQLGGWRRSLGAAGAANAAGGTPQTRPGSTACDAGVRDRA